MANDCSTMEASSVGLEEEGEEIELSLGLSIGRNFRKSPKFEPEIQKPTNADVDLIQENQNVPECMDPRRKREVHALRRQEARKKREEKLRKRGLVIGSGFSNDNEGIEAQRVQIKARDREMRENEATIEGRECNNKREKNDEREDHDGAGQNPTQGAVPAVTYPPLQFVPLAYGFAHPGVNVTPCLAPAESKGGKEKNEGNPPLGCRSFRPCPRGLSSGNLVMGGSDSEYGGRDGGNSNGSPVCGSPVVSENQSSSQRGGSSGSDTGSHSSRCKPNGDYPSDQHGFPSNQTETTQANGKSTKIANMEIPSSTIQSGLSKLIEQPETNPEDKPITYQDRNPVSMKVASGQGLDTPSLSQMPCVSTTGNGPNGKTITGFLYRYTKTEVIIVCVCHGSPFSPAEFVEHAGGKDITHPLRHITVIPSAFGC